MARRLAKPCGDRTVFAGEMCPAGDFTWIEVQALPVGVFGGHGSFQLSRYNSGRVTVLMPMRNAGAFVVAAVQSILNQSEREFTFLVIDDGSDDASLKTVERFDDKRIQIIHDGSRSGLAARLNWGLDKAGTKFVARMDADDIAAPTRLARQLAFMEANPHVGICGSWYISLQEGRPPKAMSLPLDHARLRAMSLFASPFAHPTVMFNLQHLDAAGLRYSEAVTHAEDYDMWERAATKVVLANIPEYLLFYRRHATQVSTLHDRQQREASDLVRMRAVQRLGMDPTPSEIALHCDHAVGGDADGVHGQDAARAWFLKLERVARRRGETAIAAECAARARHAKKLLTQNSRPLVFRPLGRLGRLLRGTETLQSH
ncbi:MAG: glycosyltransferase [Hyphomicrobiales bacterium]|nr:glycosyltransferase [Hyphomicrobiales bacterium]